MADDGPWTILRMLRWMEGYFTDKGLETPRLDAEVLLAHVLSTQRVMLYARFDQPLLAPELAAIKALVTRRARREPIAHLVGHREFWSLELDVNADCLIPRPDSETVIEVAVARSNGRDVRTVVDVGTGSGCLALALASELKDARVYALEASPAAKALAEANVKKTGLEGRVTVHDSDLLSGLPADAEPIELLVANLPYIRTGAMTDLMPDVRFFEPAEALDGGPDGLDLYRRLADQMPAHLAAGAAVVWEADPDQMPALIALLEKAGAQDMSTHDDGAATARVVSARMGER